MQLCVQAVAKSKKRESPNNTNKLQNNVQTDYDKKTTVSSNKVIREFMLHHYSLWLYTANNAANSNDQIITNKSYV